MRVAAIAAINPTPCRKTHEPIGAGTHCGPSVASHFGVYRRCSRGFKNVIKMALGEVYGIPGHLAP